MKKIFYFLFLVIIVSGCGEFKGEMSQARIKSNEEVTQKLCKIFAETLDFYKESNQRFPLSLKQLGNEGYLSPNPYNRLVLLGMPVQGYRYVYTYLDDNRYTLEASPANKGVTGNNTFRIDETKELKII
ncbi:MAG: membrane lipoprotein lipid attachment site-containing protein [Candidatus Omnitrophota bacterium]